MHVWNIHEVTTADVSRAIHTVWCCTWEHKIATSQTSRLLFTKRKWQRNWWRMKRLEEKKESMKQAIKMIFILLAKKPWLPLSSMTSLSEKDVTTYQAGVEPRHSNGARCKLHVTNIMTSRGARDMCLILDNSGRDSIQCKQERRVSSPDLSTQRYIKFIRRRGWGLL